jgi:hypothetical protein
MLGELISEGNGKRTSRRVLSTDPVFKVEASFEETIKIQGVEGMQIGTYSASPKSDGSLDGTGEGVINTADGMVTWKGLGVGKLGAGGAVSYRGALSFHTTAAKFGNLNGVAGVFEFDVDAAGNTHSKTWVWK